MAITPITQVVASQSSGVESITSDKAAGLLGMGNSDFMMMLMAQLKNQNPMEPMDDKNLMGQVTQLNTLNELQALSQKMEQMARASQATYAANLIGKEVVATNKGYVMAEGEVTGMEVSENEIYLTVNDQLVPLAYITQVKQLPEETE
jgi:flagellar basal-body rod modification protein FlgD